MNDSDDFPKMSLSWLLCAILVGAIGGGVLGWILFVPKFGFHALRTACVVGINFSVITWGGSILGCRLLAKLSRKGSPRRMALNFYIGWICVYALCVLAAALASTFLLGVNIFNRSVLGMGSLIGLAISGLLMGFQFLKKEIHLSRELGLAQARAQALMLRAQLSPHTLFNSLNTIAALIPEQPQDAQDAVQRLSRILRRILSALERERWSLGEEFTLLRDLLEMERARFGDRLSFSLELPEAEANLEVPPLILLPLVENALKHGFRPKVGPCFLEVRFEPGRILVVDNGVGFSPTAQEGTGLRNVRQRLESIGGTLQQIPTPVGTTMEVRR